MVRFLTDKLLIDITDYIILFPIKWYNLIKKILYSATVYNNILIISKYSLTNLKQVYLEIEDILNNNGLIKQISENKDFYILYFYRSEDINVFKYWLNLITYRACCDLELYGIWQNNILCSNFYCVINGKMILIEREVKEDQNIYITTNKSSRNNVISFEYNYFHFCQKLKEIFCLQNM